MDAHLIHVPGLGALTAGGLSGGDLEGLGGQAHRSLDAQVLGLCALQQLTAYLLQRLHLSARQGDADLVDFLSRIEVMSANFFFLHITASAIQLQAPLRCIVGIAYWAFAEILLGLLERHVVGLRNRGFRGIGMRCGIMWFVVS